MDDAAKRADRTLLVLSPAYLASDYAFAEWATAFRHDPRGKQGRVLPVRIQKCEVEGRPGQIVYIDLVGLDESACAGEPVGRGAAWTCQTRYGCFSDLSITWSA